MERRPPVPRFKGLSMQETFQAVSDSERDLRALDKMKGFTVAVEEITKIRGSGRSYHLIILNSLEKTVEIRPYGRDSFEQAVDDYSKIEAEATQGKKIEPVLVSAGPVDALRRAYPNFFLDITKFAALVNSILQNARNSGPTVHT